MTPWATNFSMSWLPHVYSEIGNNTYCWSFCGLNEGIDGGKNCFCHSKCSPVGVLLIQGGPQGTRGDAVSSWNRTDVATFDIPRKSQCHRDGAYNHLSFPLWSPKQCSLPSPTWPWRPALGHHQCPTRDKCFPVETAACAPCAGTFCQTKWNHFYLPSTALSVLTR